MRGFIPLFLCVLFLAGCTAAGQAAVEVGEEGVQLGATVVTQGETAVVSAATAVKVLVDPTEVALARAPIGPSQAGCIELLPGQDLVLGNGFAQATVTWFDLGGVQVQVNGTVIEGRPDPDLNRTVWYLDASERNFVELRSPDGVHSFQTYVCAPDWPY